MMGRGRKEWYLPEIGRLAILPLIQDRRYTVCCKELSRSKLVSEFERKEGRKEAIPTT